MSESSKRLLDLIQKRGLSYGELSERTGIPKSALQRYATGATDKIPADRAEILGRELGCSGAWILGITDDTLRVLGHHVARIYGGRIRVIDELCPEVYVDIPEAEYQLLCAEDNLAEIEGRLSAKEKELRAKEKPTLGQKGELDEISELFNSLGETQKEQAKSYLRFLKASEEKK